ncbi:MULTISPECIES: hypothetical protein [Acinetobacter]|uniref:hypothetical protein n=1 Tax=Acinetobacter TaxID=469 RepID=UPI0004531755|nr:MULTISPECIES: hypothetical protein [Acinetobacter]EXF55728.1 hypothetical protein J502_3177 [Acinetobacter sp. 1294596]MCK4082073.1 hypothetical protein [Acinetobacter radioresistens]MCU4501398.1 hypothetical protein [Acinetobacter radioresistens]
MELELLGELFGVEIHRPLQREEIRKALIARNELRDQLKQEKNLSSDHITLQLNDKIHVFAYRLEESESEQFYNYLTEECKKLKPEQYEQSLISTSNNTLKTEISPLSSETMEEKQPMIWKFLPWVLGVIFLLLLFSLFTFR